MRPSARFIVLNIVGAALILLLGADWGGRTAALAFEDVPAALEAISPSVGALYARQADGNMKFLCSATAIERRGDDTMILTANHCLEKGVAYSINFGDGLMRPLQAWMVPHYEADEESKQKYGEPVTDMALFLMRGADVPLVPLAARATDTPGTRIVMVGYPLGVAKIAYEGIIAGRFDLAGNDLDGYLLLQIFGAPGSSGSAVVDVGTGRVIAVLVAAKQAPVGLPVIFATPIEYRENLALVREGEVGAQWK